MIKSKNFEFDGGAATYLGTSILALFVTVLTLGIAYPYALVLRQRQRWQAKHTIVDGRRLQFTGTGIGLFGNWIKPKENGSVEIAERVKISSRELYGYKEEDVEIIPIISNTPVYQVPKL